MCIVSKVNADDVPIFIADDMSIFTVTLDWEEKWQNIVFLANKRYIEKIKSAEMNDLTASQQQIATIQLRSLFEQTLKWDVVSDRITKNLVLSCGQDVLNKMVGFYTGDIYSSAVREKLEKSYVQCSHTGLRNSMNIIVDAIDDIVKEKERIIKSVRDSELYENTAQSPTS